VKHAFYLIRHGQTEWSANGRHTGRTDIPLTSEGEHQARTTGETLAKLRDRPEPALVLASPRKRALRTAELAGLTADEVTEELAEWDYGGFEGLTTSQIRETVPDWTIWTHPVPDGESADAVSARADRVLARARDAIEERDVILVGHGHFGRVLVARWLGLPAGAGVHFALEPAGVSQLGDERGVPRIDYLNVPAL
jgi:broad specificity phosphatase PhoE